MGGDYIHVSQVLSMLYVYRIYDGVLCFSFVIFFFFGGIQVKYLINIKDIFTFTLYSINL